VHDHQLLDRSGERDVEQPEPAAAAGGDGVGLDDHHRVELEPLGVGRRQHARRQVAHRGVQRLGRHHGDRRVAVGQVGGDPRHHSPQLVGTRRRVDRDHAWRPTVEAHRPARHDVGRGLGEKAVGDVDDGRGHAVAEVEVGAAGGGGRPEMLDHVVPRALRPRRGRLCQVAEDRQRPSRAAPGERSEAHGRQVLCLVDDHVPVAPG